MIHVVAVVTAKPGQREAVLAQFHQVVPLVHAEAGCIEYGAAIDHGGEFPPAYGPDSFVAIEKWASAEALKAHIATPHMQAYAARTNPLIDNLAINVMVPA